MIRQQNSTAFNPATDLTASSNKTLSFEDVCAMPYIIDSMNSIIDANVRKYPILIGHEDDLRQEMLIHLWAQLQNYDPKKSSIKTFCRVVMRSGMHKARRLFFSDSDLALNYARPIHDFTSNDEEIRISDDDNRAMQTHSVNTVEKAMLKNDIESIIQNLPDMLRPIARAVQNGESFHSIASGMGIPYSTFQYKYLRPLRKEFRKKI